MSSFSKRNLVFLKDVFFLSLTTFGGPHAHFPMFVSLLVRKHRYITEEDLIELNALCLVLPGPTSTQTITAVGYKLGKAPLAYLTLFTWVFPSLVLTCMAAIVISMVADNTHNNAFTRFLSPMAIGFLGYAAFVIVSKVVKTRTAMFLTFCTTIISYFFTSPYITPFLLVGGALLTAYKYQQLPQEQALQVKVYWANFLLLIGVFVVTFVLGIYTHWKWVKLFESFYRNGAMVFGGGQVLIPLLHSEYVELKHYLTNAEFLSGYALIQAIPGPLFSISSFIGAMAMKQEGIGMQIVGSILASAGIFLPGTFMIFFVYRFWDQLKTHRVVKASLEGINAVSAGLVCGVGFYLLNKMEISYVNVAITVVSFLLLVSERVPATWIVLGGVILGLLLPI